MMAEEDLSSQQNPQQLPGAPSFTLGEMKMLEERRNLEHDKRLFPGSVFPFDKQRSG
jgi:hypothetical protein